MQSPEAGEMLQYEMDKENQNHNATKQTWYHFLVYKGDNFNTIIIYKLQNANVLTSLQREPFKL